MPKDRDPTNLTPHAVTGVPASDVAPAPIGSAIGRMDEEAHRRLGRNLRLLYASVLNQPLPERLTKLVDDLAAKSANREGSR